MTFVLSKYVSNLYKLLISDGDGFWPLSPEASHLEGKNEAGRKGRSEGKQKERKRKEREKPREREGKEGVGNGEKRAK